jgi:Fe-S-cluster containining protein
MNTQFEIKQEILSNFKCHRCGECCKISVQVESSDIIRLADKLKMKSEMFVAKYVWKDPLTNLNHLEDPCPFLKDKECTVYDARPDVCRVFPFKLHMPVLQDVEGCKLAKDIYNVANGIEQLKSSEVGSEQELTKEIYQITYGDERRKDSTLDIIFSYDDLEYFAKVLRESRRT